MSKTMTGIEKQYLRQCVKALCTARTELLRLTCREAVEEISYRRDKVDTLRLDAIPEIVIEDTLCKKYDPRLPLITEEMGSNIALRGTEDEVVCFSDPMDRSSVLQSFLSNRSGRLNDVFSDKDSINEWQQKNGGNIELSGPYGSITAIRNRAILFSVMINYITGMIYIASENWIGRVSYSEMYKNNNLNDMKRTRELFDRLEPIKSPSISIRNGSETKCVAYCKGKKYEDNLCASKIFQSHTLDEIRKDHLMYDVPGGPARILYLFYSDFGFIFSNGEKITEWLGWLAFTKYSTTELLAYELSFDASWTRDGILMAPSQAYSILGDDFEERGSHYKFMEINLQKLKYLNNPSQYRSTIVICPESNRRISMEMRMQTENAVQLRFHSKVV